MEVIDPVVRDLQARRLRAMSAHRKLEVADELLSLARELKSSSLRTLYPGISDEELRARVSELFAHVAG
jgi:predicted secreted protein